MTNGPQPPTSSLAFFQPKQRDVEATKLAGWNQYGILVVSASDSRLTWPDRELVKQLGAKLYGKRKEAPNG